MICIHCWFSWHHMFKKHLSYQKTKTVFNILQGKSNLRFTAWAYFKFPNYYFKNLMHRVFAKMKDIPILKHGDSAWWLLFH